jgi:hypothetical protein
MESLKKYPKKKKIESFFLRKIMLQKKDQNLRLKLKKRIKNKKKV